MFMYLGKDECMYEYHRFQNMRCLIFTCWCTVNEIFLYVQIIYLLEKVIYNKQIWDSFHCLLVKEEKKTCPFVFHKIFFSSRP